MRYLVGIDDTDNLESRGTGHRARQMAMFLAEMAIPLRITRHQLLVSPEIPYTSHNSSACLLFEMEEANEQAVWEAGCEFLVRECAPGSDAGYCLARWDQVDVRVQEFGMRAKREVLTQAEAMQIAREGGIRLQGLTGTHGGVIGSLAGVGLHCAGNDGRFLWLPGMRELGGVLTVSEVMARGSIDRICPLDGPDLSPETLVNVGDWVRPILRNGQATLYVEEHEHEWTILPKDRIKTLSN